MGARNRKRMRRHSKHHVEWLKKKQVRTVIVGTFFLLTSIALLLLVGGIQSKVISGSLFVAAIYLFHKSWFALPILIKKAQGFETGVETEQE
jgi:hypothetical protein